jgi:putative Mn2+ efflux pump MntP
MSFGAILLLAIGLSMDAMAVAAARGLAARELRARHVALVAAFFGGFQAFMPLLGWLLGSRIGPFVEAWDHWIAFVLLVAIGAKMLWEAKDVKGVSERSESALFAPRSLLVLAVATSIDALAAGLTLPMLGAPLVLSLATIGVTTAALSSIGLYAGRRFGNALGRRLDAAGGIVLIALGAKILADHLRH